MSSPEHEQPREPAPGAADTAEGGAPSDPVAGRPVARVHPMVDRAAAYTWRIAVIALAVWVVAWVLWQLRLVVVPAVVAVLITVVLTPPAHWLRRHRLPNALAAWLVFVGFIGALVLAGLIVVPPVAREFSDLGPVVQEAVDSIEDWLVEDSPFDLSRSEVGDLRERAREWIVDAARSSQGRLLSGAVLLAEVVAGILLSLVMSFFFVKDAERIQAWATRQFPDRHRDLAQRLGRTAWTALGGYLRGSATLGLIEAIIIGTTVALTGAELAVPIMVVTFIAAFIPFVGAIVAGILAVLVTGVSAGLVPALIVAAVALAVQQFDNDVLAPVVFGRTTSLHPVVVLLSVTAGATLVGIVGAFLAVPVAAVAINVTTEVRAHAREQRGDAAPGEGSEAAVGATG